MESLFLQTIRSEPGNPTHPLIFADWLEEQGDPRSLLVRLWQQAVHAAGETRTTARRSLRARFATLPDLCQLLAKRHKRLLACDCAERVLPLIGENTLREHQFREALEASRRSARRECPAKTVRAFVTALQRAHRASYVSSYWRNQRLYYAWRAVTAAAQGQMGALWAARLARGEEQMNERPAHWAIACLDFAPEYQQQYLLALSYHLFDANCLPESHPSAAT